MQRYEIQFQILLKNRLCVLQTSTDVLKGCKFMNTSLFNAFTPDTKTKQLLGKSEAHIHQSCMELANC